MNEEVIFEHIVQLGFDDLHGFLVILHSFLYSIVLDMNVPNVVIAHTLSLEISLLLVSHQRVRVVYQVLRVVVCIEFIGSVPDGRVQLVEGIIEQVHLQVVLLKLLILLLVFSLLLILIFLLNIDVEVLLHNAVDLAAQEIQGIDRLLADFLHNINGHKNHDKCPAAAYHRQHDNLVLCLLGYLFEEHSEIIQVRVVDQNVARCLCRFVQKRFPQIIQSRKYELNLRHGRDVLLVFVLIEPEVEAVLGVACGAIAQQVEPELVIEPLRFNGLVVPQHIELRLPERFIGVIFVRVDQEREVLPVICDQVVVVVDVIDGGVVFHVVSEVFHIQV